MLGRYTRRKLVREVRNEYLQICGEIEKDFEADNITWSKQESLCLPKWSCYGSHVSPAPRPTEPEQMTSQDKESRDASPYNGPTRHLTASPRPDHGEVDVTTEHNLVTSLNSLSDRAGEEDWNSFPPSLVGDTSEETLLGHVIGHVTVSSADACQSKCSNQTTLLTPASDETNLSSSPNLSLIHI